VHSNATNTAETRAGAGREAEHARHRKWVAIEITLKLAECLQKRKRLGGASGLVRTLVVSLIPVMDLRSDVEILRMELMLVARIEVLGARTPASARNYFCLLKYPPNWAASSVNLCDSIFVFPYLPTSITE
jgi:hypothetical protein